MANITAKPDHTGQVSSGDARRSTDAVQQSCAKTYASEESQGSEEFDREVRSQFGVVRACYTGLRNVLVSFIGHGSGWDDKELSEFDSDVDFLLDFYAKATSSYIDYVEKNDEACREWGKKPANQKAAVEMKSSLLDWAGKIEDLLSEPAVQERGSWIDRYRSYLYEEEEEEEE